MVALPMGELAAVDPRPVGVFDSGLGGLTVVRAILAAVPSERIVYLGDTARVPYGTRSAETVIRYARENVDRCEEYVFLDKLQYLAAGGRLSKTSAFFGDMLRMKPVISPLAEGAKKMGVVRTQADQVDFAQEKLAAALSPEMPALIMLEYSDNRTWVAESVQPEIARRYPAAEIVLHPLSLTSGAHMGPGTWAVAFLPAGE